MKDQKDIFRRISGPNLSLRLIEPEDAAYVYGLRTNSRYNLHLSEVNGSIEDQRRWIEAYKEREANGAEFYYIVERLDGLRCGTVRLYGIEGSSFTWGSWILDELKPAKAALESACLVYKAAFNRLGLRQATFDVRKENEGTLAFHRRFGAEETHATEQDIHFVYLESWFARDWPTFLKVLEEVSGS